MPESCVACNYGGGNARSLSSPWHLLGESVSTHTGWEFPGRTSHHFPAQDRPSITLHVEFASVGDVRGGRAANFSRRRNRTNIFSS